MSEGVVLVKFFMDNPSDEVSEVIDEMDRRFTALEEKMDAKFDSILALLKNYKE